MNKNLEILEFHKILEMLANLSANEITREKVRTIVPCSDLAEARTELEKTNDAFQLSVQFGAPPFHAFQDTASFIASIVRTVSFINATFCSVTLT